MYYTYLIRCGDKSLYAGITTDPARRLAEHRGGKKGARYTRTRGPLSMAALWESGDRSRASRLEALLKKASHEAKERLTREPEALSDILALPPEEVFPPAALPE